MIHRSRKWRLEDENNSGAGTICRIAEASFVLIDNSNNRVVASESRWHDVETYVTFKRGVESIDMGGVPSSSLSVERLQGAEVVSAHLKISGGSRPAELFSDGFLVSTA